MRSPEQARRDLVRGWLAKAEEDLLAADAILAWAMSSYGLASFHAQQAVEKALKALLTRHALVFEKTHNIRQLLLIADRAESGIADRLAEASRLTLYAVESRYPGEMPPEGRAEAAPNVTLARATVESVTALLRPYVDQGDGGG
jgi:HEPN domain-containing protein